MDGEVGPDVAIARIAGRQHGVVSVWQLHWVGIKEGAVRNRVLKGRLHAVHRGVFAVGHTALSWEARCMAAVLALAQQPAEGAASVLAEWGVAVSHRSAASLWGLLPWAEGPVHVAIGRRMGKPHRRGIRVHRPRRLASTEVTLRAGIPLTTPARTLSDLEWAAKRPSPGAPSPWELRRAVRQAGVLGFPLDEEDPLDRTRSDLESALLRICRRHRLPDPEVNVRVGPFLVDFLWRDARLVVEADAYRYHRGRAAFREDHRRDLELRRLGYDVLRVSEQQIDEEAAALAEEIERTLGL